MPRALPDGDPQGAVLSGGQGKAVVLLGGEPLVVQGNGDGVRTALRRQHIRRGPGQLVQPGGQGAFGALPAGSAVQHGGGLGQHRVPHQELQRLVLVGIGVGHHVEAEHLIGQGALAGRGPQAGSQRQAEGQEQRGFPEPQLGAGIFRIIHKKHRPMYWLSTVWTVLFDFIPLREIPPARARTGTRPGSCP